MEIISDKEGNFAISMVCVFMLMNNDDMKHALNQSTSRYC